MRKLILTSAVCFSSMLVNAQHYFTPIQKIEGDGINGFAKIVYENGEVYIGHCKDSLPDGEGTQYIMHSWLDSVVKTYVGEFKNGQRNGKGTITYANGEKYVGDWKNGLYEGQGKLVLSSGITYEGGFEEDRYSGKGIYNTPEGDHYEGEFKNSMKHGYGVFSFPQGGTFEGQFVNDYINGTGSLYYPNGDKYIGEWKMNNYHGQGTFTKADGTFQSGVWKNSIFLGESLNWLDSIKEVEPAKYVKQNWVSYTYLAVIVHFHTGYYYWDWSKEPYITEDQLSYVDEDFPVIVTDTFYFTIDLSCFYETDNYKKSLPIDSFHDFVQTDTMVETKHSSYNFYWVSEANFYRDSYRFGSGIGVNSEILEYLVKTSAKQLEPRAIEIYNNNLAFESDK